MSTEFKAKITARYATSYAIECDNPLPFGDVTIVYPDPPALSEIVRFGDVVIEPGNNMHYARTVVGIWAHKGDLEAISTAYDDGSGYRRETPKEFDQRYELVRPQCPGAVFEDGEGDWYMVGLGSLRDGEPWEVSCFAEQGRRYEGRLLDEQGHTRAFPTPEAASEALWKLVREAGMRRVR